MEWKEVLEYLKANKDSKEVLAFITQNAPKATLKDVQAFLKDDPEGVKLMNTEKDRAVTKGIDSFKDKTLPGLIAAATKEAEPSETDKRLAALEQENAQARADGKKAVLENHALKELTGKKLPADLSKYVLGDDEEATDANIVLVGTMFTDAVSAEVEVRLKAAGGTPPNVDAGKQNAAQGNPWKKGDTFNLTEQGRLLREDPKRAALLAGEAGVKLPT